jgi:hypothetical protein
VNRDPIGYLGMNMNLYQYVRNNPLSMWDPSGLISTCQANLNPFGQIGIDFPSLSVDSGGGCFDLTVTFQGCSSSGEFTIPLVPGGCIPLLHTLRRINSINCKAASDCPDGEKCTFDHFFTTSSVVTQMLVVPTPTCIIVGFITCQRTISLGFGSCECPPPPAEGPPSGNPFD